MNIIKIPLEMQKEAKRLGREGQRIALVPTMGYLHEGHLSLLREARKSSDKLVISIFVNPLQFGADEDFDLYPRDMERDLGLARSCGADIAFTPDSGDLYPGDFSSFVEVEGLTETLCGRSRPGHFRGVTTVVCKLFNLVRPDLAFFGQKDYQQLAVIRRMTNDLDLGIEIVGMPTVRESDGLAMSSRNVYLAPDQRRQALSLVESIQLARAIYKEGERRAGVILDRVRDRIGREPDARIDYAQICHESTLEEMELADRSSILLLAVYIGKIRLIDNHRLEEEIRMP